MNNTFTVLPMSQDLKLAAGDVYEGEITVANPASATEDFSYVIGVAPYGVQGEEYVADLVTETNRTQIAKWITIEESEGTVSPNGTAKVKYKITVPENAPAGGQYAAITVGSNPDASQGEGVAVQNIFEMASLIYAEIEGETVHDGGVLENNVPGFITSTPMTVTALLDNNGNVHEKATIQIGVKNTITGEVILPTGENAGSYGDIIMPETAHLVSHEIDGLPIVGVVDVSQTVYYNGETSTNEQTVVICPIWFMATVAVVIGAIIGIIVRMVVKRRRRKATF